MTDQPGFVHPPSAAKEKRPDLAATNSVLLPIVGLFVFLLGLTRSGENPVWNQGPSAAWAGYLVWSALSLLGIGCALVSFRRRGFGALALLGLVLSLGPLAVAVFSRI